jgi:glucokinase
MTGTAPAPQPANAGEGPVVLAVDVGGTHLKAGVMGADGTLGMILRRDTPRDSGDPGEAVIAGLAALLADEELALGRPVEAIGLTVPGIVDERRGVGIRSTNLGWTDFPFRDRAAQATGRPVALAHDVRAAGDAEHRLGAARGAQDVAIVTIGTGIAAALILDGTPYVGRGYAGELGHTVVDPAGPICRCGRTGCLEAIASARAIADRYRSESADQGADAALVLARAAAGDELAGRVWADAVHALAVGLDQLAALVAPELIVIGGGLSEAGEQLMAPLRTRFAALRGSEPAPALVRAELGQDAGTWGAALAARDLLAGLPR